MPYIVALTAANDSKEERKHCEQAGMQSFLIKPPAAADLQRVLTQVFGTERFNFSEVTPE